MLRLLTFGGLTLQDPHARSVPLSRHRAALLAVMSLAGEHGISRDKLLALFWADTDYPSARARLDQMLYAIRRGLGGEVLQRGDPLRLSTTAIESDVAAFDRAYAAGEMRLALDLHRGPLLDGVHLPGSAELSRWIEQERAARLIRAIDAAHRLSIELEGAGALDGAVAAARRACALAPEDERSVRRLMAVLAAAGDRAAALRCYESFTRLLAADLELTPSVETRMLAARLRSGEFHAPPQLTRPVSGGSPEIARGTGDSQ